VSRFVIAVYSEALGVVQKCMQADSQELALRLFFDENVQEYSKNEEGFTYFKEDFFESSHPIGAIVQV
jgi:hypothetical protein